MYEVGDFIVPPELPTLAGGKFDWPEHIGHVFVFVFLPEQLDADATAGLAKLKEKFPKEIISVVGIKGGEGSANETPVQVLLDTQGVVSERFSAQPMRAALVGVNFRLISYFDAENWDSLIEKIDDAVRKRILPEAPRQILQQAPVLLIPDIFPLEFCKELMNIWETEGNEDSGFMVVEDGKTVGKFDYNNKRRRDHFVPVGGPLHKRIGSMLGPRTIPQLKTAFDFDATRIEQMKIACYESNRGGFFRAHRDNTTPGTAHRRFAISVLLNDEFEGGHVRFPEHGPHLYRPKAGGGVVFSCSLLHEATDVTAGRRFVLLTFFYGEKEARAREEYNRKTGGNYKA